MSEPTITDFAEALARVPHLAERLERALQLQSAAAQAPVEPLPQGIRSSIRRLMAVLALAPTLVEVVRLADGLDLRDLTEHELAYLEDVHVATVRKWRLDGKGPEYRNESGISYPVRLYFEWRERGRQRMTSQKATRGRRP
jgi:hypothetical protein